jgi:hypothetical protein
MNTASTGNRERTIIYLVLLALQVGGAAFVEYNASPAFRELILHPGQQVVSVPYDSYAVLVVLIAMQCGYWYRLNRLPIPFRRSRPVLSHIFLFLARLSFIFGGALFTVVLFRHLPQLHDADPMLAIRRGIWMFVSLFALFCATLELERLGRALSE